MCGFSACEILFAVYKDPFREDASTSSNEPRNVEHMAGNSDNSLSKDEVRECWEQIGCKP